MVAFDTEPHSRTFRQAYVSEVQERNCTPWNPPWHESWAAKLDVGRCLNTWHYREFLGISALECSPRKGRAVLRKEQSNHSESFGRKTINAQKP